jgi:bifunctional non-homologous end joining protein LigD
MLLTSAPSVPAGDRWIHEAKLDGWRCLVEVSAGRVQVWSRRGGDYTARLPELQILSRLGDVVLDGELVVVTEDGRAAFELLSSRVNGRSRRPRAEYPIALYVFDALRRDGHDLCGEPWADRRAILEQLDVAGATSGVARTVSYTPDGEAMHQATLDIGAEGTVSKKTGSVYLPGQRVRWWTKTKHRRTGIFPVVATVHAFPARWSTRGRRGRAHRHGFHGAIGGGAGGAGRPAGAVRAASPDRYSERSSVSQPAATAPTAGRELSVF